MFQTKIVEKIKTHILRSVTFILKSCIYDIMWKSKVERGRLQMAMWCKRIASLPHQQWLHERALILRYTYIVCIVTVSEGHRKW